MKKIIFNTIIASVSLIAFPNQTYAVEKVSGIYSNSTVVNESLIAEKLIDRLSEIDKMDKTDMKRAEKRKLRREVLAINLELRSLGDQSPDSRGDGGGGIYLSLGAIIIIVLLLIILL